MLDDEVIASLIADVRGAGFADYRLTDRLALMTSKLAANPALSFPKVFNSAELEGAYRFFGNAQVTPDLILSGHFDQTRNVAASLPTVLVVHDTSTFAFDPNGEREGLGRVRSTGQAFFGHFSLVVADDGSRCPLGMAAMSTWVRDEKASNDETARWWSHVKLAAERLGDPCSLVHVMDREADDYALLARLIEGGHRFIIRSFQDRLLLETSSSDARKLAQAVAQVECTVEREAKLSRRIDKGRSPKQKKIHPARRQRTAKLAVGAMRITLKRPQPQPGALPSSLTLQVVRVWEPDPPAGEEPIQWLLYTTDPIDSADHLLRVVDRYRARWTVEEYFKALKTGCAFPDRQLGDYEGLVNALAVFVPIACRCLALRSTARRNPDAPALRLLEADELDVLRILGRRPLQSDPTIRDVLLAVAALGGHIKWSGDPGWLTISRGFAELLTLTRGWRAAKLQQRCDQR
jgi:transposase-like protein/DDE family transposase